MIFIQIFTIIVLSYCIVRMFEMFIMKPKRLSPDVNKVV